MRHLENEFDILASRWQELQGKKVTKIPQEIIERDTIIQELLADVEDIAAMKDGKTYLARLVRNIKKLEKLNDDAKRDAGLKVTEYFPSGPEAEQPLPTRDLVPRKGNTRARIRKALNPPGR